MLKKVLPFIFIALVVVLMAGCVSKQDYDAVVKERDDLKAQVSSLQTDLDKYKASKSNIAAIQIRLAKELKALKIYSDYLTAVTKAMNSNVSVGTTVNTNASIDTSLLVASATKFMVDFGSAVGDVGNPELSQVWSEFTQSSAQMDSKTAGEKMSALRDLLVKLASDDTKALEAALR